MHIHCQSKIALLEELYHFLTPYRKKIDARLEQFADSLTPKNKLTEAARYALLNGGKRFRPILVMLVAEGLSKNIEEVTEAALAIECFHTASLIADDLPCMDNDATRRGKPSLHVLYGEAVALMASYGLISEGYHALTRSNPLLLEDFHERLLLAWECVSRNTGFAGATGGQFLDLFPPEGLEVAAHRAQIIEEIFQKKTASLFEISFVTGWLFGGGALDPPQMEAIRSLSHSFGMAFQIMDDLQDLDQDSLKTHALNYVALVGTKAASEQFLAELDRCESLLTDLGIYSSPFQQLLALLKSSVPA